MQTNVQREGDLPGRLKGEIAIVTGSARGIGKAIAARLSAEGAAVALLHRHADIGEATAAEFRQGGGSAMFAECDIRDHDSVRRAVAAVVKEYGHVSALANIAGITLSVPFLELSREAWSRVIDTNLTGTFLVSQEVCRQMAPLRRGSIVNMGSIAARIAHSSQAAYAMSKAGIEALTRAMAFELAPVGIRVNAIAPGTIATEFLAGLTDEAKHLRERRIPMGRLGTAEEVADVVAFLLSDDARYMTGSTVTVDGGLVFAGIRV